MKLRPGLLITPFLFFLTACMRPNLLTKAERSGGWTLLFDGKTTRGWRGAYQSTFPEQGWIVSNGRLMGVHLKGVESGDAGDIVTLKKYKSFELVFDWKIGKGGNSGVKYFVEERLPRPQGSQVGYEYQLIDDANYIYNGKKLDEDLKTASIYDVLPANKENIQVGVWHNSRIIVKDNHIEHWLDGKKVLDTERTGDAFLKGVEESKFKDYRGFAGITEGHILLQDHGHNVVFKNIKIKE